MADMDSQDCFSDKDLRPWSIQQSEETVSKVLEAIAGFMNPFEMENKDNLYCLSSRAPAPSDIEQDLL